MIPEKTKAKVIIEENVKPVSIPENVKAIMQKLLDNGFEAYIIGGAVRDKLLEKEPHDYDIFTNADGKIIKKLFPKGVIIGNEERQKKILTVIVDDVEVSQYRANGDRTETGTSLKVHQSFCDFTVNAMAMDINEKITHYDDGNNTSRLDINHKILRFCGNPYHRLLGDEENDVPGDKLRAMRAAIRKCKDGFKLQKASLDAIMGLDISDIPPERVRDELIKIMEYENGLDVLDELRLLPQIIPELYHENMLKSGGTHHDETPQQHSFNAFRISCGITDNYKPKLASTLHDIGKSITRTGEGNDIHFYSHEAEGSDIAKKILTRLKFKNDDIKKICYMIRNHMFGYMDKITKKGYVKFFHGLEKNGIDIMHYVMVLYCDNQGNEAKKRLKFGDFIRGSWLLGHYWECKYDNNVPFTVKELEVGGKDLIEIGIKPGPEIGKMLNLAYQQVLSGKLENKKHFLMSWIRSINRLSKPSREE